MEVYPYDFWYVTLPTENTVSLVEVLDSSQSTVLLRVSENGRDFAVSKLPARYVRADVTWVEMVIVE